MRDRVITAEQAAELAALYRLLHGDLAAVAWFTRDGENHTVRLPALGLVLRHYWHDKGTDKEQFAGTVEDEREVRPVPPDPNPYKVARDLALEGLRMARLPVELAVSRKHPRTLKAAARTAAPAAQAAAPAPRQAEGGEG